ncbi:reverse transcriptase domain-containing protein [Tanacetum coccineum]
MKEMLRNCHGHNLSKGNIIKIFYHGLSEITQEVLNAAAGGIFLYKTPNQAYQLLKDKVLLKLDWAKNQKTKTSLKKTVAFADEGSNLLIMQSGRPSGSLPSNTQPNLKGHNSKAYQPPQSRNVHVNVVFTRSGKSYNPPVNPNDQQNDSETPINFDSDDKDEESTPQPKTQNPKPVKETQLPKPYKPKIPYPQRLRKENMKAQYGKFLDMIRAVRINVPLIDVLAEMNNYGKFIKELVNNKHKIEQISVAFLSDETDLGASINLMPYSLYAKLSLETLKPTKMSVRLADRSFQYPVGLAENMLIEVVIRVQQKQLNLGVGTERMIFNIDSAMKHSYSNDDTCFSIDVIDEILEEDSDALLDEGSKILHFIEGALLKDEIFVEFYEFIAMTTDENSDSESDTKDPPFKKITINTDYKIKTSLEEPHTDLELKPLPDNLEYVFLEEPYFFLHSWYLSIILQSQIQLLDDKKPIVQKQRRLNPNMQEVVKKEIVKLLDTGIIYPIADSPWVSPIHCVPKKGGITVVTNENDELVPTRTITGWRVCIDYRKLNEATAKDHFPLPFMDQMLERLAGNKYFCFLDGFSGYFQIPIDPNDQEKTTFTCPFGTYAYRRMPFGLCNAPATFQRCMLAIFHDMIEESVKVFMDDFSVFGNSFDTCLNNLDKMLQRCKDAHLVLNWEKCHFMVKEGIVLGHKVSSTGLEVDKAKIDVISKLPPLLISKVKGTENVAADHLSRIENDETSDDSEVDDNFPRETIMEININEPWFADFANYLVGNIIPKGMTYQQKNKFFSDLKYYFWEEPYLFKVCSDGPFPKSYKFEYILVAVDYVSKWAEAQALPTNYARVVVTFLKKLFCRFRMPKALISDRDNPAIWSRKLDDALWAFRTTYKTPTDLIAAGEKKMFQLHKLDELRHQAYENSHLYKERTKVWHDRKLRMRKEFKKVAAVSRMASDVQL